jgi:hypothetical protein
MSARPTRPEVLRLAGTYVVYTAEHEDEGVIENARRVRHPDGRIALIIEQTAPDDRWDLRVESSDGRRFRGRMTSPEWDVEYPVSLDLWAAPDGEREWLLLGTWTDDEDGEIDWSIALFVEDDEDA